VALLGGRVEASVVDALHYVVFASVLPLPQSSNIVFVVSKKVEIFNFFVKDDLKQALDTLDDADLCFITK